MPYAYDGFDNTGKATVVPVGENDLLPLLVMWSFFTVNPAFLVRPSPQGYTGFDFQKVADQLGLSTACVQNLFLFAEKYHATLEATGNVFQKLVTVAGYQGPEACGATSTLMKFADVARSVWQNPELAAKKS
jgi:hypothetical protein